MDFIIPVNFAMLIAMPSAVRSLQGNRTFGLTASAITKSSGHSQAKFQNKKKIVSVDKLCSFKFLKLVSLSLPKFMFT